MNKEDVLASLAVLVLSGVLVYAYRQATENNAQPVVSARVVQLEVAGGDMSNFNNGASIYVANTPYLFSPPVGNVVPPTSDSNTLPGSGMGDLMSWIAPQTYSA